MGATLMGMDAPLGRTIGNALEVREAIDVLFGRAPADLTECMCGLCAEMLLPANAAQDLPHARQLIADVIGNEKAADVMGKMVAAQGGDRSVGRNPQIMASAPMG